MISNRGQFLLKKPDANESSKRPRLQSDKFENLAVLP